MKQVVENGNDFTQSHFFLLLMNLSPAEVEEPTIMRSLKIFIEELEISEFEYTKFNYGVKDVNLQKSFETIRKKVFAIE